MAAEPIVMGLVANIVSGRRGVCSPGYKQLFGFKNSDNDPFELALGTVQNTSLCGSRVLRAWCTVCGGLQT